MNMENNGVLIEITEGFILNVSSIESISSHRDGKLVGIFYKNGYNYIDDPNGEFWKWINGFVTSRSPLIQVK